MSKKILDISGIFKDFPGKGAPVKPPTPLANRAGAAPPPVPKQGRLGPTTPKGANAACDVRVPLERQEKHPASTGQFLI